MTFYTTHTELFVRVGTPGISFLKNNGQILMEFCMEPVKYVLLYQPAKATWKNLQHIAFDTNNVPTIYIPHMIYIYES